MNIKHRTSDPPNILNKQKHFFLSSWSIWTTGTKNWMFYWCISKEYYLFILKLCVIFMYLYIAQSSKYNHFIYLSTGKKTTVFQKKKKRKVPNKASP